MAQTIIEKRIYTVKRFCFLAYAFFLPFSDWSDIKINSFLLILLTTASFTELCFDFKKVRIFLSSHFYILAGILLIQWMSLFQGGDFSSIESGLMIKLPFLLFPFIMLINGVQERDWRHIKMVFIVGCFCALVLSFRFLLKPDVNINDILEYHTYENYLILHRPYFGIYLLMAIVFLFDKSIFYPYSFLFIFLFVFFLWLIQAKISILIFLLILFFYAFSYAGKNIRKWLLIGAFSSAILISFFSVHFYLSNRNKQNHLSQKELFFVLSVNTRLIHWDCALDIFSRHLVTGVGEGNVRDNMNACYQAKHPFTFQFVLNFNVHNEFLEEGLRHGIIGMITYFICFFFFFRMAFSSGDRTHLYFLFIIVLASLTETTFSRSQGVLMISFFNTILYLRSARIPTASFY